MALDLSYAVVLAAETLGRVRAVVCLDARSFRNFASDRAGRLFPIFFPGEDGTNSARTEKKGHEEERTRTNCNEKFSVGNVLF